MDNNAGMREAAGKARLQEIDFTKGALVIFMVLYHAFNYSTELELGFKYLGFLPPSFIFITGYLIAAVYFRRPPGRDAITSGRMIVRGVKLLVIFTALNVAGTLVSSRNYNGQPLSLKLFFSRWEDIYLYGAGSLAAFEVLLPIAYVLLLGPLLLWLSRRGRWTVPAVAALTIAALAVLESRQGIPVNVAMMAAGLLGAALGGIPQRILSVPGRFWYLPIALYALFAALAHESMSQRFLAQLAASFIAVTALYALGSRFRRPEWLMNRIYVLGNYSLLAYIVQIAFLQILFRRLGRPEPDSLAFLLLFLGTLMVTVVVSEATAWWRTRSAAGDRAYRLIFT
jgi:peptidoglycan/LPS O-acetylase OafA/YrhL